MAIVGPAGEITALMLVDSGSDFTIIPNTIADALGIEPGPLRGTLRGYKGSDSVALARAEFRIEGLKPFRSMVAITDDENTCLLGHRDFFHQFFVSFDTLNRTLRIVPHEERRSRRGSRH